MMGNFIIKKKKFLLGTGMTKNSVCFDLTEAE